MNVGDKIAVTRENSFVNGTVTQVEICFFCVRDDWNGNVYTYHWNEDIKIEEESEENNN